MLATTHKYWAILVIALCSFLTSLALDHVGALDQLERISYDWRVQQVRSNISAPDDIAIILIDDASLQALNPIVGRWPWPRSVHADVIDFLSLAAPKAIVFDILFLEDELNRANDLRLAAATSEAGNVIHAMQIHHDMTDEYNAAQLQQALPSTVLAHALAGLPASTQNNNSYYLPIAPLVSTAAQLATVNVRPDDDGIYRRVQLRHVYRGVSLPSLSLAPLLLDAIDVNTLPNELAINYYGHITTYSMSGVIASAQQLMQGDIGKLLVDPYEFENKIVFIGASAVGLEDLKATPLNSTSPGVVIHASVASNLISNDVLHTAPPGLAILTHVLLILLTIQLVIMSKHLYVKMLGPILLASLYIYCAFYAFSSNYIVMMTAPLSSLMLAASLSFAYLLFTEGRDKQRVRTMLGQYVSPAVLGAVVDHYQDHLKAEVGSEEQLSILFSDIRGFTSMSESIPAQQVVEILNHYFSAMTATIFDRKGTIDKFIGDAIMAFWGAPIRDEQHADHAVQAAIAMHARLTLVNDWLRQRNYPEIAIGVGIHSGKVILGNIGSEQKLDYTIIGDNVNLASRLEGLTKTYGCAIVISESTQTQLSQALPCYVLDLVRVKGKQVPIRIFSPILNEEHSLAEQFAQICQQGFDAYLSQQWQTAIECYQQLPDSLFKSILIQRCRDFQHRPPAADWDGVFRMSSK